MKLVKFKNKNSYNWGIEAHITAGGKWRKTTLHNVPLASAEREAQVHITKGRKTEIRKGKSLPDGQDGYQVWAYICKKKSVLHMATKDDCLKAGVTPGPSNV
ncbi:hypothetical protein [Gimesia maris]|uniref:hypothetical protein n=1 Tax=Gimesia maris TaxID=122 RepID=UPI0032EC49E6